MLKKAMNNKETYRYISRAKFTVKSAMKGKKVYWCWLAIVLLCEVSIVECLLVNTLVHNTMKLQKIISVPIKLSSHPLI